VNGKEQVVSVYTQEVHYKLNPYGQVEQEHSKMPHEWESQHLVVIFLTGNQWSLSSKFVCREVEWRWKLRLMPIRVKAGMLWNI